VVKFTTFLVHSQDIETFMAVRNELYARLYPRGQYPPNTLVCWRSGTRFRVGEAAGRYTLASRIPSSSEGRRFTIST
jgi:hypothetical protein